MSAIIGAPAPLKVFAFPFVRERDSPSTPRPCASYESMLEEFMKAPRAWPWRNDPLPFRVSKETIEAPMAASKEAPKEALKTLEVPKADSEDSWIGVRVKYYAKCCRYAAEIRIDGKQIHIGMYDTAEKAAHAYDERARQCSKPRKTNFDDQKNRILRNPKKARYSPSV